MHRDNIVACLLMMLNALALSLLYATKKVLSQSMEPVTIVLWYKFIALLCVVPWVFRNGVSAIRTPNLPIHILRGVLSVSAGVLFAKALAGIPVVDATAINLVEPVLWVFVGAWLFNERVTKERIAAILLSIAGVLWIIVPNALDHHSQNPLAQLDVHYLYACGALVFWLMNSTLTKVLGHRGATNEAQTFYVMVFAVAFCYLLSVVDWGFAAGVAPYPKGYRSMAEILPPLEAWPVLFLLAVLYFTHTMSFFNALKRGEFSVVMPFEYSKLLFSALLGFLMIGEVPTSAGGYLVILTAGLIAIQVEQRRRSAAVAS